MAMVIKQATAIDVAIGPFLDETDGKTAETGLTITQPDVRLKKNGGAWAQKAAAQTLSHEEAGWYEVTLDATDTDTVGQLIVAIHEAGALPVWREFQVVEEAVYDALFAAAATGALPVASGGIAAAAFAAGAIDAAALAADAGSEIGAAVWATAARTLTALDEDSTTLDLDATIRAAVGLASANLDTQLTAIDDYLDTEVAAIKAKTDNLPASPAATGDIPSAAAVADAVWDEATAGHVAAGSFGKLAADVLEDTATTLQGELDGIQADTEDIQSRLPAALVAGRIDASVGAMAANTLTASAVAADAVTEIQAGLSVLDAAGVRTAVGLAAANLDTQLAAIDDAIDTEVAAIKAKTDNLPTDPADQSAVEAAITAATSPLATAAALATVSGLVDDLESRLTAIRAGYLDNLSGGAVALASALATVAGYLDTEVAAILAAVDTEVAAIKAKTDNLPASPAAVGSAMTLDLTQAVPTSNTGQTVGDALNAARAQGFGKWVLSGTSLVLYAADGVTVVRTFTLDSATAPTSRT